MWRLSPPCWNSCWGNVEHFCSTMLLLADAAAISAPVNRWVPLHTCAYNDNVFNLDPWVLFKVLAPLFSVCILTFAVCQGLGPHLCPDQKTSSWGEKPWPNLRRNLREIPGAMDTPGGIWCKESVICTSNTLLNQSQAATQECFNSCCWGPLLVYQYLFF